jgi:hypothetical protein
MRIYSDQHKSVVVTLPGGETVQVDFCEDGAEVSPKVGKILLHVGSLPTAGRGAYYTKPDEELVLPETELGDQVVVPPLEGLVCPVDGCKRGQKPFASRDNLLRHIRSKHPDYWGHLPDIS